MKKKWFTVLAASCVIALVTGCSNETESIAVESIMLNRNTLMLEPGETKELTATIKPDNADDKTVRWSSSDMEIAVVESDGTVVAIGIGTAVITAQADDKKTTCEVTVHIHSYSGGKCTVCGFPTPSLPGGIIDDNCALLKYTGNETTVILPNGVTSIGDNAFFECSSLTSITIPDSVKRIGWGAFQKCSSLTSVVIPDGVTNIEFSTFEECTSLTSVTIPVSVTNIGDEAFKKCTGLKRVEIPNSVTRIGWGAFQECLSLTSVVIPNGVMIIGTDAFRDCTSLKSVVIPDSVTAIDKRAFFGCTSLDNVTYEGTKEEWEKIKGVNKGDLANKNIAFAK